MNRERNDPTARIALGVVAVALLLRLLGLNHLPPSLFVDEAYTAYDALSVAHTGRDLWGTLLPVYFPSWGGDAVEGLYRYLCVPFVALLGPTAVAARLPAALAGGVTVGVTYVLGRRLLGGWPGVAAAALLALSPWHVAFSRIAFRGILLPTLLACAVWAAVAATGLEGGRQGAKHPRAWWLAALLLGLTLYSYSTAKLLVPLFVVFLGWVFRADLRRRRARSAGMLLLVVILGIPAAHSTLAGRGQVRFANISVFRPAAVEAAAEDLQEALPWVRGVARNPVAAVSWRVVGNYLSHFHPRFLLLSGDANLRHSPAGVGQLLWVEGLLLLFGLVQAVRRRSQVDVLLVGWFLLGPLADSLTTDRVPNALRALGMLPAPQLLAASGAAALWCLLRARGRSLALGGLLLTLAMAAGESARSAWLYADGYSVDSAEYWNAGYPEGVEWLANRAPMGARLLVARPEDWRVSRYALNPYYHSLILLYGRIPPERFLEHGLGRWEVLRIPERGRLGADQVPAGAWLLLPEDRAEPADVGQWITPRAGGPRLAVLIGSADP